MFVNKEVTATEPDRAGCGGVNIHEVSFDADRGGRAPQRD
jgi:hypothetical protein